MAKEYIASQGFFYQEINVSNNQPALEEMMKLSGQMGVPTIIINGQVTVGFDKNRIDTLLGLTT